MRIEHPLRTAITKFLDACDAKDRAKETLEEEIFQSYGSPLTELKAQYKQAKQAKRLALEDFQEEWRAFKNNRSTKV